MATLQKMVKSLDNMLICFHISYAYTSLSGGANHSLVDLQGIVRSYSVSFPDTFATLAKYLSDVGTSDSILGINLHRSCETAYQVGDSKEISAREKYTVIKRMLKQRGKC